tara:strand:+ start:49 stop:957 length:909 start_codon:yes stop_codon:yes gene_type:complete
MEIKQKIKLGIIGVSDGNGHPYSWSSIFNGYDKNLMETCPYSSIPNYLAKYSFPDDSIKEAEVTHIWTQNKSDSIKIANTTYIKNIVSDYKDMIGKVDGILLARDDYENHLELSKEFLKLGIPIYIDKSLATTIKTANKLFEKETYGGQIFTGSALAYDPKLETIKKEMKNLGKLKYIFGTAPGSWDKYSIHLVDPVLYLLNDYFIVDSYQLIREDKYCCLKGINSEGALFTLQCLGGLESPLRLTLIFDNGFREINFHDDPFLAFRAALHKFTKNIKNKKILRSKESIINAIKLISLGIDV